MCVKIFDDYYSFEVIWNCQLAVDSTQVICEYLSYLLQRVLLFIHLYKSTFLDAHAN